jgi:hypothetical protein
MPTVSRFGNLNQIPDLIEHPDWIIACVAIEGMYEGRTGVDDLTTMYTIMPIARWMMLSSYLAPLCAMPDPAA